VVDILWRVASMTLPYYFSSLQGRYFIMRKTILLILTLLLVIYFTGCDVISEIGKDDDPSVDAAEDLIDDGDIGDAIDMLEEIIDDDEDDYETWKLLIEAYIENEAYEDAADTLEDMGKVIVDNYVDDDIKDAMDTYEDLAEDIMKEDEDIIIRDMRMLLVEEGVIEENGIAVADPGTADSESTSDSTETPLSTPTPIPANNNPMTVGAFEFQITEVRIDIAIRDIPHDSSIGTISILKMSYYWYLLLL
jgi:tetratricopeptide (TPR) repeat protein